MVTVRTSTTPLSTVSVTPDPLSLVPFGMRNSADSDLNGRIDLVELTRVIDLYNTRNGTTRTGQYRVQAGTEDGFAAGP